MIDRGSHISDQDLLLLADSELSQKRASQVRKHLSSCCACHSRWKELQDTLGAFVDAYREKLDRQVSSPYATRAILKARLSQLAGETPKSRWRDLLEFVAVRGRYAYF